MKNICIAYVIFFLWSSIVVSQDIHFSNFYESPQCMNPALAGFFNGEHRFIINYKNQWKSVGSPYKTFAFSYDLPVDRITVKSGYLALGAYVFNDKAGDLDLSTSQALVNIAYHLKLSENQMLSAAISGGAGQKSMNFANAQWGDQYNSLTGGFDPAKPTEETMSLNSFMFPDFGFGLLYSVRSSDNDFISNQGFRANIGAGFFHVNTPDLEFYSGPVRSELPVKYTIHGQAQYGITGSNLAVCPEFMYNHQNKMNELLIGSRFRYLLREKSKYTGFIKDSYFTIGCYHRFKDALIILTQIEIDNFAFGLVYDFNVSELHAASSHRGGPEISLRYIIPESISKRYF